MKATLQQAGQWLTRKLLGGYWHNGKANGETGRAPVGSGAGLPEHTEQADTSLRSPFIPSPTGIWIDVGAHLGEKTFAVAEANPGLRVYAFEPNLQLAAQRLGRLPNYVVVPMAVAERDGCADFYVNAFAAASSLLPFHRRGLARWVGGEVLRVEQRISVPTIRLDTFMQLMGIDTVEYLKIDAQGADLAVIRSLGGRIRNVKVLSLEVQITECPLYRCGSQKREVLKYMQQNYFVLASCEAQSHGQEENLTFARTQAKPS